MSEYGFVVTTFNDAEQTIRMVESLKESIDDENPPICVVDGGSNIENTDLLEHYFKKDIDIHDKKHLSEALNAGFDEVGNWGYEYIFWVHQDMEYFQPNWAKKLVDIYKDVWPLVGRMSPGTSNIDCSIGCLQQGEHLRHGNSCPVLMSDEFVRIVKDQYGFLYDPAFVAIGGNEDNDLFQRIAQLGYMSAICSLVDVWHEGMGTRKLRDTNADQIYNRNVYHSKWGDSPGPSCDFDLAEVNKELEVKFGYLKEEVLGLVEKRDEITRRRKNG